MTIAAISLSLGSSLILFIFLLLVLCAVAILFYRYTLPPLPARRRLTLTALRSVALALLLLIIFEPVLRLINTADQPPALAILIDDSQSMTLKDASGERAASVRQFLSENSFGQLPSGCVASYFKFSSRLQGASGRAPDTSYFKGETTNMSEALRQLKERAGSGNIQAIVLISDGDYNIGKNPIYSAEALGLPIYTVGVGDSAEQKDLLVEKVSTNNLAYADTRVPVDITIKSSRYGGEKIEVNLYEGSALVDRKVIALIEGTREYNIRLFAEPKEEGTKKFRVSLPVLEGELTDKNNSRTFFIKVLRSKLRVMMFAGAPDPDVAALRQVLSEDEHLSMQTFIQKNTGEFYEGVASRQAIDSADCLVFVGFPSAATRSELTKQLQTVLEEGKKPLLFINGRKTDYVGLQLFAPYLPFSWSAVNSSEVLVFPSIAEKQKIHPLVSLGGEISIEGWQQLPPIYKSHTVFRAKPESEVISSIKLQNTIIDEPLISSRSMNRQKTFALTGYGIWRWRLLAQNDARTEKLFSLLMTNVVRWLTTKEDNQNVRITPAKETFSTAEPVEFSGEVYDDQLRPVNDAEVTVELERLNQKFQLNSVGNGRYEGSFEGIAEGDYNYNGMATADGKVFGRDKGKFSVGQMNAEYVETKLNKQLMEQIAYRTGGKYYDIAGAGSIKKVIFQEVKFTSREIASTSETELWNWKYLGAALIFLLAAEWFMRKRSGMI